MTTSCKNILVPAPHTGDGELRLKGAISRLVEDNKKVAYAAFSTTQQSAPEGFPRDILKTEVRQAIQTLGIEPGNLIIYNYEVRKLGYVRQKILGELICLEKVPDSGLVFVPNLHDVYRDRTTIAQESLRAFKDTNILGYGLIWNNLTFNTQCFIRLEECHIDTEIRSLRVYKSQGMRDYLSKDFIYSLARVQGVQAGCTYAEAFEVIRLFL